MMDGEKDAKGELHQRRRDDPRIQQVIDEQARQREEMQRNTELTAKTQASVQRVEKQTRDLVLIMQGGKVTMGFFRLIGKIVVWVGGISAAVLAIWALIWAMTHGGPPSIELPIPHDLPHR